MPNDFLERDTPMFVVGIANLGQHLYGATASSWEAACKNAGTTPRELESAFRAMVDRR